MASRISPTTRYPVLAHMAQPGHLLKSAIFTRIGVGLVRIFESYPTEKHNPNLNRFDKWRSFWERTFIEAVGILTQVLLLYGPLEAVGRFLESKLLKFPVYRGPEKHQVNKILQNAFNLNHTNHPKGMIAERIFNGKRFKATAAQASGDITKILEKFPHHRTQILTAIESFQRRVTFSAAGSLMLGVLCSALLSGYVLQWVNDNLFSPIVVPWILKATGVKPIQQTEPFVSPWRNRRVPPTMLDIPEVQQRTFWI